MYSLEELIKIRDVIVCQIIEVKSKLNEVKKLCYDSHCDCIRKYEKEFDDLEDIYKRTIIHIDDLRNRRKNM